MADIALPTDTMLDRPRHGSRLDAESAALVKAALLLQPQVPELHAQGLSDTEIVDTMVELLDAGLFELIQHGDQIGFIPTEKAWTTPRHCPARQRLGAAGKAASTASDISAVVESPIRPGSHTGYCPRRHRTGRGQDQFAFGRSRRQSSKRFPRTVSCDDSRYAARDDVRGGRR